MMLLKNENRTGRRNKKAMMKGKIIEIHDNGNEIGFWFYAGPGSNQICLLKQALFASLGRANNTQSATDG